MYYTIRKDQLDKFLTYGYSPAIGVSYKECVVVDKTIKYLKSTKDESPFHLVYDRICGLENKPVLLKSYFYVGGEYHHVYNLKVYSDKDYM